MLVRHLLGGPLGFQELRARTGIAPRVLSARLRALAKRGFVEPRRDGGRAALRAHRARPHARADHRRDRALVAAPRRSTHLQVDAERASARPRRGRSSSRCRSCCARTRAAGVDLTFEIRLTGLGGGVWTVRIARRRLHACARASPSAPTSATPPRRACGAASRSASPTPRTSYRARPDDQGRRPRGDGPLLPPDRPTPTASATRARSARSPPAAAARHGEGAAR